MKRRSFIKTAAGAAAATPILLGGMPMRAATSLEALAQMSAAENDKILLIIQLFGGNDGLNTLIPAEDDEYYRLRPGLAIPKTVAWNKVGDIYLNPALAKGNKEGMARMLEQGTLAIVQGVGYDNPNLSHFRSSDIWLSGINNSAPNARLDSGWVGRFLEERYPDFPLSLPPDPLAIQFGGFSLALMSAKGRMGIEVTSPDLQKGFITQTDTLDDRSAGTSYQMEYEFIADIASRSNRYAQVVKDAYTVGKPLLRGDYANNSLAKQIASTAALIAGGLKTKVYVVSMGGFDTHFTQQTDPLFGAHPTLLERLSDAVAQFMHDMTRLGHADRVLGMTVSEFGRRPQENGSFGTDHGAASVQFVFGSQVNSGVYGAPPDLKNLNSNGDLNYSIDYREVYAEILTDWFGLDMAKMRQVLADDTLMPIDILRKPSSAPTESRALAAASVRVRPEPFRSSATADLSLPLSGPVSLDLSTVHGAHVATLFSGRLEAGTHSIPFTVDLPPGVYLLTVLAAGRRVTRTVRVG
jgi:uncharacterized protein (DUF1501 family)